jgi:hypothetical protein
MKNKYLQSNKIILIIFSIFLLISTPLVSSNYIEKINNYNFEINSMNFSISFSNPVIKNEDNFSYIDLLEANSYTILESYPKIPVYSKVFELPFGSELIDLKYSISKINSINIQQKIKPIPFFKSINDLSPNIFEFNDKIYDSDDYFPDKWLDYKIGVGINKNDEIVKFLSLSINPIRYNAFQDDVQFVYSFNVEIFYSQPKSIVLEKDSDSDLVIITPSEFFNAISSLVEHKNEHDMHTIVKTIEDIYSDFNGRDNQEKIKYFVKYAVEEWNVKYVLLIGDIYKLPIRTSDAYPWSGYHGEGILSDLYYADIYNEDFMFCSWDSNNNNVFGEAEQIERRFDFINIDGVDLYPDVHIGRIPCSSIDELSIVIDKIKDYENSAFDQIWFNKIILAGGDTFPLSKGSLPFVYEGEITNTKVAEQLPDFEKIKLWSSKHNLNAHTFNKAIKSGAGFLSYAGHGFEHGWGTYRPNSIRNKMGILQPLYYIPFIKYIKNDFRLPIIFFDACLTAKLDFNISDLKDYYGFPVTLINLLPNNRYSESDFFSPLTWSFLKEDNGGSIASIGATRPAYTYVDRYGVYAGAGYLDVHFFKAYEEGVTLGKMLTQSQMDYINYVGKDFFTIEEFMLIGDPSLKVGGYP